jgi:hypothetical protein
VIFTAKFSRFFEGDHVAGILDHADGLRVASRVAANIAGGIGGKMKTGMTQADLLAGFEQSFGQGGDFGFGALEDVERETLGAFGADAG